METLKGILKEFDDRRTKMVNDNQWKEDSVADCFKPCAEQILCNGYFLVNDEYIIDLGAIELYYHEENGCIKDPIMYHTNDRIPKVYEKIIDKYSVDRLPLFYQRIANNNNKYPYFCIANFNLHQSGIDVTFEKKDEYRASFLIRSYRMYKKDDWNKGVLYDPCSSHLYDDLSYLGVVGMSIKWITEIKKMEGIVQCPRLNVSEYRKDKKGVYVKDKDGLYKKVDVPNSFSKMYFETKNNNGYPEYFKSGSKTLKQDMRPWRFYINGLEEKSIK